MEGEVSAMAAFLGQLTEAFTEILKCVTATATTIVGNPFLLFTCHFPVRWWRYRHYGAYPVPELN